MIQLINVLGRPRCFNLKTKGDTLRMLAYETKSIQNEQMSKEIELNVTNGTLVKNVLIDEVPEIVTKKRKGE